ncbi:MAG TPA: hypothetical protein VH134_15080 [Candidatus Dormibacteraeota bacterium]|nr:hypothetical protein [Candidatus Dormibacteraeota bacterium]
MSPFRPPGAFARASVELRGPGTGAALAEPEPDDAATAAEPEPDEAPPRRTGHAFYAEEARRALGVVREIRAVTVARVPAPVFHGVVGAAVALTAVLVRPQNTGWVLSPCLDFALVVLTALAIIHYDLVLCPEEHRPGPDAFILPVAAVISLAVSLAGSTDLRITVLAVLIAAGVIVAAPHLAAMRAAGLGGPAVRHLREAAPLLVCVPSVLAGAAPGLSWWVRGTVVLLGTTATAYDAGRTEDGLAWRRTALAAVALGLVLAATATVAGGLFAQAPSAVSLLMLWYGLRGLLGGLVAGRLGRGQLLEYGIFIVLAGLVLGVGAAGR